MRKKGDQVYKRTKTQGSTQQTPLSLVLPAPAQFGFHGDLSIAASLVTPNL